MISEIQVVTETDQLIKVIPNWEGDIDNAVMVEITDGNDPDGNNGYVVYATISELESVLKAAKTILEERKGK